MKALIGIHLVTALALAGCGLSHHREIGSTETTGATLDVTGSANIASQECVTEIPIASVTELTSVRQLGTWPEPMGSTYSDVGMPNPLPDVPVVTPEARGTPNAPTPPPASFIGTSFGPSPASTASTGSAFPGTTFGPPAPASTVFRETTFDRDGGA
jgi:hypothetical protein